MARRIYSDEDKATALAALAANGGKIGDAPLQELAVSLGVIVDKVLVLRMLRRP